MRCLYRNQMFQQEQRKKLIRMSACRRYYRKSVECTEVFSETVVAVEINYTYKVKISVEWRWNV